MGDIKEANRQNIKYEPGEFIKDVQNSIVLCDTIKELTTDPSKKSMEGKLQQLIIDDIETSKKPKEKYEIDSNIESYKDTDLPIYEKLSPGDIYVVRIIDKELEIIQNDGGDIKYKRVALSIDKSS